MRTASSIDLCFLPATELATRIRRRDISPVEAVESYLRRIEERNPAVNAYTLVLAEQATDAARAAEAAVVLGRPLGPLHGVPVAIKDLDDVAGVPTSMGSLAVENRVPKTSAAAVERLLEAGAIVLGKTNIPEFGHKGITDNLPLRSDQHAVEDRIQFWRLVGRQRRCGSRRHGRSRPGHRWRRLGPDPGLLQRGRRIQAFLWPSPIRDPTRRFPVGPSARAYRATCAHSRRRRPYDIGHGRAACRRPADASGRWRRLLARRGRRATGRFRVAFSPQLGDFPVDRRVAGVVKSAVEVLARSGIQVDEVKLDFGADHDALARLWVRVISVHYGAIARHWKPEGVDLLGEHSEKLDSSVPSDADRHRETILAVDHALDDVLRTGVFVGLQFIFERYDLIVSPTLAIPPVRNASDGNTIGPTDIGGDPGRSSHRLVHDVPDQFHWASGDIGPGRFDPRGPSGRPADHRPQPRGRNRSSPGKPLRAGATLVSRLSGTGQRRYVWDRRLGEVAKLDG